MEAVHTIANAIATMNTAIPGVDGSPEMAAEAACRLGRPVETLRFDQLDEHDQYDAVWASACLLHVPKADLQGVLARI
jgi:hypothetical protein